MSNLVIGDYTAAVTIDGGTHYLLIQPGNSSTAYKKITRDVYLGVSGQPADISTAQNITNKTLDNTNILTLRDDRLTLQDSGDVTRQAQFQLSSITAGQTRVYTLPDATTTLVGTGVTQTLTNKTLTSPTITGGTIDNSTITVDAIGEHTSANGVTIDGLNIKDGALNTNNSVVTANITDAAVTPAKLQSGTGSGWAWSSWVPTWTNLTAGNGTLSYAKYIQIGKTVHCRLNFIFGNSSSVGGAITFSLPVTANADYVDFSRIFEATIGLRDISASTTFAGGLVFGSTTTVVIQSYLVSSTQIITQNTNSTTPMTWATSDIISVAFSYEAA